MRKIWQKQDRRKQKTILVLMSAGLVSLVTGFLIGSVVSSRGEKIELNKAKEMKQNEIFKTEYSRVIDSPGVFWLGPMPGYNAYINQNRVIYIKKESTLSPSAVAKAMTIITEKKGDGSLFQSFKPLEKIGQDRYFNNARKVFVWMPPGDFLAYSENIESDPGGIK